MLTSSVPLRVQVRILCEWSLVKNRQCPVSSDTSISSFTVSGDVTYTYRLSDGIQSVKKTVIVWCG